MVFVVPVVDGYEEFGGQDGAGGDGVAGVHSEAEAVAFLVFDCGWSHTVNLCHNQFLNVVFDCGWFLSAIQLFFN